MIRLDPIRAQIEEIRRARSVPGIVVAVQAGDEPPEVLACGEDANGTPLRPDSIFPVASITKPATALAVLRLIARGDLDPDAPLARHLPDAVAVREESASGPEPRPSASVTGSAVSAGAGDGVTIRSLLCHTGGLPFDLPRGAVPYARGLDWPALARGCLALPRAHRPWSRVQYSNIGYALLAIVVERRTGRPFEQVLREEVLAPLGIEGSFGNEPSRPPAWIAGEYGDRAGTDIEPYNSSFWRSLALPYGGLLTTAAGAIALIRAFHGRPEALFPASGPYLPRALLSDATRDQTRSLGGGLFGPLWWDRCPWGLGVELRGDKRPHWTPASASAGSYGHAGASGCLAWHDPAADVAWALCGTRTFEKWWVDWHRIGAAILGG